MTGRGATTPILRVGGNLLVCVQQDLDDRIAESFQAAILTAIERRGDRGLLLDISALDTVDTYVARVLADTSRMARLMGTETVIVGMRPEVAATLVQLGYPLHGLRTALNIDDGLALLARVAADGW